MHELGIVFHIIKSVEDVAAQNKLKKVNSVTIQLGEVSGVLHNYLDDCWNWACTKKELMNGAKLIIEVIPAVTYCEDCKSTYNTVEHGKTCPNCKSESTYLISGNEINIKEIEAV
ncbi:MAG: hydrogenase maturation nickel metallochaperone HypA [Eubacterium sp.]|nr:hydrogenase maturation nickel metallochaperone HypA [Eubacterium sp.]